MHKRRSAIFLVLVAVVSMGSFTPPDKETRLKAIGLLDNIPDDWKKPFLPGDDFRPMGYPHPGDWLAEHHEPGQTFRTFVRKGYRKPSLEHEKIYIQPLGTFPVGQSPSLIKLKTYAEDFFGMPVKLAPAIIPNPLQFSPRKNTFTKKVQLLTPEILAYLEDNKPADAYLVLGVTMTDLYPRDSWNFVFGQANMDARVGVFSFARYDPLFYGEERDSGYEQVMLERSLKVMVHEMGHMFGLWHCIYFQCVMNGSNHLAETDSRPMHLCPVCLRKLQYSTGFEVRERYRSLGKFYRQNGFEAQAAFLRRRLDKIGPKPDLDIPVYVPPDTPVPSYP